MPNLEPYDRKYIFFYFVPIAVFEIIVLWLILSLPDISALYGLLPTLSQINGAAFAFIFSIGMYLLKTSERITSEKMPMFGEYMIAYIMIFVASIVIPLLASSLIFLISGYNILVPLSFALVILTLSLIPLSFEKFRYRLSAQSVIGFLANKAKKQLKSSNDWGEAWSITLEIERIAMELHEDRVDLFANALANMLIILDESEEIRAKGKKSGSLVPPQDKWIGDFYRRLFWVGQKVVNDFLAYERVCAQVKVNKTLTKYDIKCHLLWELCKYAIDKNQDSLKKALVHAILACGQPSSQLLNSIPYPVLSEVVNELKFIDPRRETEFDEIKNLHPNKPS